MANGRQLAETRIAVLQPITHVLERRVRAIQAVWYAAEAANPVTGLRERDPHVPAAAVANTPRERAHRSERHQVAGRVVERLAGESFWLVGSRRLGLGD